MDKTSRKNDEKTGKLIKSEVTNDEMFKFIDTLIAPEIEAFTVKQCIGYWKGAREHSTIVEIIVNANNVEHTLQTCKQISEAYAQKYNQDAVLISVDDASSFLIESGGIQFEG